MAMANAPDLEWVELLMEPSSTRIWLNVNPIHTDESLNPPIQRSACGFRPAPSPYITMKLISALPHPRGHLAPSVAKNLREEALILFRRRTATSGSARTGARVS